MDAVQRDKDFLKHASTPDLVNLREQQLANMNDVAKHTGWNVMIATAVGIATGVAVHAAFYPFERMLGTTSKGFFKHLGNKTGFWMGALGASAAYITETTTQGIAQEHNRINVVDDILADRGVAVVKAKDAIGRPVTAVVSTQPQDTKVAQVEHKGAISDAISKVLG